MSLKLTLSIEKDKFYPGESIPVKMILRNDSGKSVTAPDFAYNSDLTELLVLNDKGEEIARLNDFVRQELMGFFVLERIDAPENPIKPGEEKEMLWDVSKYYRILDAGNYKLMGSYRFYDKVIESEPVEIEIMKGTASNLNYTWQMMKNDKWRCRLVYKEKDYFMNMCGLKHNPEVIDYNLPVEEINAENDFVTASSCYDKEDFRVWLVEKDGKKINGTAIDNSEVVERIKPVELSGRICENGIFESYDRKLVVPEILKHKKDFLCRLHLFSPEGKKIKDKDFPVGKDAIIYDAESYKNDGMLMVYGEPTDKGFDFYSAIAKKDDFSDLKTRKLCGSSREFIKTKIPFGSKPPGIVYAVSFDEKKKELWIYNVNLDPNVRTTVPPKIVLKSQGELSFYDIEVDNSGAVYLLFVEDGHKLLFYHVADNEFHFITEDKFADAHLIITPDREVYLTYIDERNVVCFRRMVEVVKSH